PENDQLFSQAHRASMGLGTQFLHRHIRHLSDSVRAQFRGPAQSFSRRIIFLGQHVRHSQTIKLASLRNGVLLHRPFKLENSLLQLSPFRGHVTQHLVSGSFHLQAELLLSLGRNGSRQLHSLYAFEYQSPCGVPASGVQLLAVSMTFWVRYASSNSITRPSDTFSRTRSNNWSCGMVSK